MLLQLVVILAIEFKRREEVKNYTPGKIYGLVTVRTTALNLFFSEHWVRLVMLI